MKKFLYKSLLVFSALFLIGAVFLPKNQQAYALESVYLGGIPIGIKAKSEDFVVTELVDVITKEGSFSPAQKAGIQKGDILLSINRQKVETVQDVQNIVRHAQTLEIEINRRGDKLTFWVTPALDAVKNEYKIGLFLRNDIGGIGTLTYITKDGKFGALGHKIGDSFGYSTLYQNGEIYDCFIYGYKKAENKKAGELCGRIGSNRLGTFYSNQETGINGYFTEKSDFTEVPLGRREDVRSGKAQIYTTIDGNSPKLYEIEILKTAKQEQDQPKGMLIRVTDAALLRTTGGILQGMSGSPVLQDGKLIGAVTHVLTDNSSLGYGVYIDWMINK